MAYLLWAVGGWCGLHHFYLKRHAQAILWCDARPSPPPALPFPGPPRNQRKTLRANNDPPRPSPLPARIRRMTSGMVFGWGGLRDVWRMPAYVREVNADPKELRALEDLQRAHPRPEFNPSHVSAMTSLGFWYYYLVGALASWILPAPAMPLAYACAAWAMGTAGWAVMSCGRRVTCSYWITTGSTVVAAVAASHASAVPTVLAAQAVCAVAATFTRRWRRDGVFGKEDRPITFRAASLVLLAILALAALSGAAMYKWAIDLDVYSPDPTTGEWRMDGEEFAFRLRRGVHSTWTRRGFAGFGDLDHFNRGITAAEARATLSLDRGASAEDVKAAFRRESLRWHPDKYRGDDPAGAREMQHKLAMARDALLPGRVAFDDDLAPFYVRYTEREVEVPDDGDGGGESGGGAGSRDPEPKPEPEPTREPEKVKYYREEEPAAADDDDSEYDPKVLDEELRRAFATYDRDEDGKMARGEFRFAMSKAGLQYTADEFEKVWSTEFNGKPSLDFDDFARFVVKHDVEPPVALEQTGGHDATEL